MIVEKATALKLGYILFILLYVKQTITADCKKLYVGLEKSNRMNIHILYIFVKINQYNVSIDNTTVSYKV